MMGNNFDRSQLKSTKQTNVNTERVFTHVNNEVRHGVSSFSMQYSITDLLGTQDRGTGNSPTSGRVE